MEKITQPTRIVVAGITRAKLLLSGALFGLIVGVLLAGAVSFGARLPAVTFASAPQSTHQEALPFGPGWAATYCRNRGDSATPNNALPFGPGWAAEYGVIHRDSATTRNALPFGSGLAADYGTNHTDRAPAAAVRPFGPEIAATYGVPAK